MFGSQLLPKWKELGTSHRYLNAMGFNKNTTVMPLPIILIIQQQQQHKLTISFWQLVIHDFQALFDIKNGNHSILLQPRLCKVCTIFNAIQTNNFADFDMLNFKDLSTFIENKIFKLFLKNTIKSIFKRITLLILKD